MNYFSTMSFAIALKVSFSGKKEFFCSWKVSKFLHAASFAVTQGKLMLANSRLKILGQSETPTSKTNLLIFLTNKRLLAGTIYIRFLIYLKAIYEQKMKEIDFSTLATKLRANAPKNRAKSANRGHSSKPNLPSFSVCNKVLMSL